MCTLWYIPKKTRLMFNRWMDHFLSTVVRLHKFTSSPFGYSSVLWSIQGLNTNMSEATDDWEFLWRENLWYLHVLIIAVFCPFLMQLLFGLEKEVSKLKWRGKKSTFCPQQWNITSMPRPLPTEGACSHTETEHLLHFNMLLPHFQNIRRDTTVAYF